TPHRAHLPTGPGPSGGDIRRAKGAGIARSPRPMAGRGGRARPAPGTARPDAEALIMSDEQATGGGPGASTPGGLAGAGISGGMAGTGAAGAALGGVDAGGVSDAMAGGDNLGGGGPVGAAAVGAANNAGASSTDM